MAVLVERLLISLPDRPDTKEWAKNSAELDKKKWMTGLNVIILSTIFKHFPLPLSPLATNPYTWKKKSIDSRPCSVCKVFGNHHSSKQVKSWTEWKKSTTIREERAQVKPLSSKLERQTGIQRFAAYKNGNSWAETAVGTNAWVEKPEL